MNMELSWTDQCFLTVLLIGFAILINSLRKEHVRRAFFRIFQNPIAVSAGIIFFIFLTIGILDSIHFRGVYKQGRTSLSRIYSVLDYVLMPLGNNYEKTYSEPLALTLYTSETVPTNGSVKQTHPRLKYPPAFIKDSQQKWQLIYHILVKSALISLLVAAGFWLFIVLIRWFLQGSVHLMPKGSGISAVATFFVCVFILISAYWLSRYLHILGTGKIGEDVFYYAVKSIRTGLIIGTLTTLFMLPLALLFGIAAGYFGGIVDDVIQYIYTTLSSIPGVLLITASVLSMQTYIANHPEQFSTLAKRADARLLALCFILGVTSWTSLCRLLRAEALKLREVDYVLAARALGSRSLTIFRKHLLPNVMHIVIITLVLDFSFLVLAEAVLSYVGVGVSPLTMSWGNMINGARLELAREPIVWWPMLAAFLFMFTLVLASNLLADAVRDVFDPNKAIM